ncbi:glycosyltransferase family 39 protein [Sphingobium yanoikuyae]|nr:glycosyltransferase family 39 protein [Sphingobium yanoikuyae]
MYRSISMAPSRRLRLPLAALLVSALIGWFLITAMAAPFDHDESQYVAGAYFSGHAVMFRDFLYLQPPLHAWVLAPLSLLASGHMVLALRLATAVMALATLALIWAAQRAAGISRSSATLAMLLMAATAAFQFSGSVVRNDMLPTLLASAAMLLTLLGLRHRSDSHWLGAGLLFGLAIATKLNFAPLGATVGLFVIASGGRHAVRAALFLALGALLGMAPMAIAWISGPDGFLYGILTYGMTAPHAWYAANGAAQELATAEKLRDLLKYLWKGPALVALLLLIANWIATRGRTRSSGRRLAIWMSGGALIGAALPTPTQLQYLMPLLPPLALALGYLLDDARHWRPLRRKAMLALLCLAAIPGLIPSIRDLVTAARTGSPLLAAQANAHWLGMTVRAAGGADILTLSPHLAIDSGLTLDPRLATGPFVYRTGWTLRPEQARRLHALTPATLPDLGRAMPAAILTGYENGTRKLPLRPDDGLDNYARHHGYRMVPMPDGVGRLYLQD